MPNLIQKIRDAVTTPIEFGKLEYRAQYTRDGSGDFFDNISGVLEFLKEKDIINHTLDDLPEHISDYSAFIEGMKTVEVSWTYNPNLVTADTPKEESGSVKLPGSNAWEYLTEQVREFGKGETDIEDVLAEAHSVRVSIRELKDGKKTITFDYIGRNPLHKGYRHESADHYFLTMKFRETKPS